ncbi:MAG: succinyl-diaminopimelate desuccinylase [Candidatus Ancillula sp.]|jgi:succinyl-diaminopimelate desuccinylase|nr:succinyl-diaminopimelate desuccinylase [Candidatus Ancillula sp.]
MNIEEIAKGLLSDLVDIDSVSGNEKLIADYVEGFFEDLKVFEVERIENRIVAKTNFGLAKRLILAGHLDTVPISKVTNNYPSKIVENNGSTEIWGRGTVDMKGGDAVMLMIAAKVMKATPKYDLTFVFYDNEEVEAPKNGLGKLVKSNPKLLNGDMAILFEPTNGYLEGGCNGTLRFDIVLKGKAAHSARAYKGDNAIHKLLPILQILNNWNGDLDKLAENHTVNVEGLDYIEGLNAVKINGGITTNSIPDECRIHINYRFAPNKSAKEAQKCILDLFDGFEVDWKDVSDGAKPGMNRAELQEFAKIIKEKTGKDARAKLGWTDVARFTELKIPAVNFAPGDPNLCHADDEHIELNSIVECFSVLGTFIFAE